MPKLSVFQTVLLAVFGALAISGVLIFALVVGGGSGSSVGAVSIWGTFESEPFRAVIQEVAGRDDRYAGVTYEERDSENYMASLTEALATGVGPDIFVLQQDYAVRDVGKLHPIPYETFPEARFKDTFIEAAEPYLSRTGVLAVPVLADPLVLYWNRDIFAAAGYANPPRFWDELPDMTQRITKRDGTGRIEKSAVSFGEYRNVTHAKDILSMLILQAGGVVTQRNTAGRLVPALQSSETESALRFYTEFADPSKVVYSWNRAMPESRSAFVAGDLALYIGYASEQDLIVRANPNLNFAVAAVPQVRGAERPLTLARVYALAVTRTAANLQGAIEVAATLASAEASRAFADAFGIPSVRRDVLGQATSGEGELFNRQAIISRAWADPDPARTDNAFRAMIENVTTGAMRLSEAVQRADREIGAILE